MPKKPDTYYKLCLYLNYTGENREKIYKLLEEHYDTLAKAQGSMFKHQAWPGGWLQHVCDTIEIARIFMYATRSKRWPIPFKFSSVVLVLFLHDLEKPFMQLLMALKPGTVPWSKLQRESFRRAMITRYNVALTKEEEIALKYVEGEGSAYHSTKRVMNELGALCHSADVLSARLWPNRNKPENID